MDTNVMSQQHTAQPVDAVLFDRNTQAIFWNNHQAAIQRMLDYDTDRKSVV